MTYQMNYDGGARQVVPEKSEAPSTQQQVLYRPRRRFAVPSIFKTAGTIILAGGVFFAAEGYAPPEYRPSTLMGTYDARVTSAVKAAELGQQARYDQYAAAIKLSADQQNTRYRSVMESFLSSYKGALDRGQVYAHATANLQQQYVGQRMDQTRQQQSMDVALINYARLWSRLDEALETGTGEDAQRWADSLSSRLSNELTEAATNGVTIKVEGWDYGLASVDELRRQMESVQPLQLPPVPSLGETPASLAASGVK